MNRAEFRHQLATMARAKTVFAVVAGLIVLQALMQMAIGGADGGHGAYRALGLRRESFFQGSLWQIFTYGFIHGGWLHLSVNVAGLVLLGSRVEWLLGSRGFQRIALLGLVAGGSLHLAASQGGAGDAPILVGFSAAVVAFLLLITTLSPESRMWPLPVSGRALGLGIMAAEGMLALMDPALRVPGFRHLGSWVSRHGGSSWFEIAHACHFGGGLVGWVYGRWLLRRRVTKESLRRARERREAGGQAGRDAQ